MRPNSYRWREYDPPLARAICPKTTPLENNRCHPNEQHRLRGLTPQPVLLEIKLAAVAMATANPWYGYKRIAVMCPRASRPVTNQHCCRALKAYGLLQKRKRSWSRYENGPQRSGLRSLSCSAVGTFH